MDFNLGISKYIFSVKYNHNLKNNWFKIYIYMSNIYQLYVLFLSLLDTLNLEAPFI